MELNKAKAIKDDGTVFRSGIRLRKYEAIEQTRVIQDGKTVIIDKPVKKVRSNTPRNLG
jgi:hypothetical protein